MHSAGAILAAESPILKEPALSWRLLVDERGSAAEQMAADVALAVECRPTLRLFRWRGPAFSTGFRQAKPDWLDPERCRAAGVELVERPTGGGLAVHGSDLSCAVVLPQDPRVGLHEPMRRICAVFQAVCSDLSAFGAAIQWRDEPTASGPVAYCLAQPSSYALLSGGRKLMGFAVRRFPASWLIQGSMLVRPIPQALFGLMPPDVQAAFQRRALDLQAAIGQEVDEQQLIRHIVERWGELWDAHAM